MHMCAYICICVSGIGWHFALMKTIAFVLSYKQNNSSGKRMKQSRSGDENGGSKTEGETSSGTGNKPAEQSTKPSEPPKQDYIHVRARRGQATDSHSLAERVIQFVPFTSLISEHSS